MVKCLKFTIAKIGDSISKIFKENVDMIIFNHRVQNEFIKEISFQILM